MPGPENMISVKDVTELKEIFKSKKFICVSYFSPECAACKAIHAKIGKLAESKPDVTFLKINCSLPGLKMVSEDQGIKGVPYFQLVLDGEILSGFSANFGTVNLVTKMVDEVYYKLIESQK